ncbi:MAG: hypothetical protein KDH20_14085 [Rhodocyclaceae bacterium]|nr:hypothetical protein [Rhodocyclaceae bacterium]
MNKRKGRRTLLLLALVCTLPVVASYATYYLWQPEGRVNYGELLEPSPLPSPLAPLADDLRGRWTLVYASDGPCDADCETALYYMRQVRTAQGEHMDRVERLWLRAGSDGTGERTEADGMVVAQVDRAALAALPATEQVLLLDPLGHVMMRFPVDPDPKRMIRDLARLLKYSRIG